MDSLGLKWSHWDSLGFTWTHLDTFGFNWIHVDSLGFTRESKVGRNGAGESVRHLSTVTKSIKKGTKAYQDTAETQQKHAWAPNEHRASVRSHTARTFDRRKHPRARARARADGPLIELQSPSDRITHTGAIEISQPPINQLPINRSSGRYVISAVTASESFDALTTATSPCC